MQSYSYESREILIPYVQDNFKIFSGTLKNSHFFVTDHSFFSLLSLGRGLENDHWRVLGCEIQNFTFLSLRGEKHFSVQIAGDRQKRKPPLREIKPQVAEKSNLPISLVNGTSLSRNDYFWCVTRSHFFTIYERDLIEPQLYWHKSKKRSKKRIPLMYGLNNLRHE